MTNDWFMRHYCFALLNWLYHVRYLCFVDRIVVAADLRLMYLDERIESIERFPTVNKLFRFGLLGGAGAFCT